MSMKNKSLAVLLCCLLSVVGCSSSDDDKDNNNNPPPNNVPQQNACAAFNFARTKVANGSICSVSNQNSPLVRLLVNTLEGTGVCTGTVIDNDKILTAAHCVEGTVLGISIETTNGRAQGSKYFYPATYRAEDNRDGSVLFDDVAIVYSSTALGIAPMPVFISQSPTVGEVAYVGGYGENAPGQLDATPRAGSAVVTAATREHVTIRYEGNQAHPCQGDSGGPLVVERSGSKVISGVVSQSAPEVSMDQICRPGDITLYTGLRSQNVLNFLSQHAPDAPAL